MNVSTKVMVLAGSLLLAPAVARAEASLLDFDWHVHICKKPDSRADCTDNRRLKPHSTFGLHQRDGRYWLELELPDPTTEDPDDLLMKIQIPAEISDQDPSGDPTSVVAEFKDFADDGEIVTKRISLRLVRRGGNDVGGKSCRQWLDELPQGKLSDVEKAEQCSEAHDSVVYWSIGTIQSSGDRVILGPPGDGEGTGSGSGN
jgi:hypothetical protein